MTCLFLAIYCFGVAMAAADESPRRTGGGFSRRHRKMTETEGNICEHHQGQRTLRLALRANPKNVNEFTIYV
jgi:hypothetical protein